MRYSQAVEAAPPGSATFRAADIRRLTAATLRMVFADGPASPPLSDVALALGADAKLLACLEPARAVELQRLAARPSPAAEREAASQRLVRALFWFLVYELASERWDALASAEPVHPLLLASLPCDGARVLDVAAGSGRLSAAIAGRAARLVAVEPSRPLRRLLQRRLDGRGWVVAAFAQRLPVRDGWADLVTCCASLAPEPPLGGEAVLAELERCCRPGGEVALIGPENAAWFEARGYRRIDFGPLDPPRCDPEIEAFFGRRSPPRELLLKRV
jgi:SAM-dependent methyltransferase